MPAVSKGKRAMRLKKLLRGVQQLLRKVLDAQQLSH